MANQRYRMHYKVRRNKGAPACDLVLVAEILKNDFSMHTVDNVMAATEFAVNRLVTEMTGKPTEVTIQAVERIQS